jgi:hypothetical protein
MLIRWLFIFLFSNRDTFTFLTQTQKEFWSSLSEKGNVNMRVAALFFFFLAGCLSLEGFSPAISIPTRVSSPSILWAGGFGGGGASANKVDKKSSSSSSSKQMKLKPKQQWDRYIALKGTTKIPVGVRMKEDGTDEWIKVGYVRSKEDAYTEVSVAMQRALIAEVS